MLFWKALFFIVLLVFSSVFVNGMVITPVMALLDPPLSQICDHCGVMRVSQFKPTPLHQFKLGIDVSKLTCFDGLVLIKKISDNSPACVKPDTSQKLVERGWGTILLNYIKKSVIISTDADKSSKAYNASMINQIQNTINSCTNSKIHLGYGLGSENFVLTQVNETCNVDISGDIEMGTFSYTCNVPLENMTKWVHWKDTDTPPFPDDIMGFCKRTH